MTTLDSIIDMHAKGVITNAQALDMSGIGTMEEFRNLAYQKGYGVPCNPEESEELIDRVAKMLLTGRKT